MSEPRKITKRTKRWVKIAHDDWSAFLDDVCIQGHHAVQRGAGSNCCDEICQGHGGCRMGRGNTAICNDGDVFICNPEA